MHGEVCSWCGEPLDAGDGFRLVERAGARRAAFCRLEHVVPWALRGAHWEAGETPALQDADAPDRCAVCEADLDDARLVLVRHRGEHRVSDAFCGVEHMQQWARAGGRWR